MTLLFSLAKRSNTPLLMTLFFFLLYVIKLQSYSVYMSDIVKYTQYRRKRNVVVQKWSDKIIYLFWISRAETFLKVETQDD